MKMDDERKIRIRRMVADTVLADKTIFTTPVGQLTEGQALLLQAALRGPHALEIMEAMEEYKK